MPMEIELKLRLSPAQARRLPAHTALSGLVPQRCRLLNTYYDTADFDLRKRRIALRLRRKGRSMWLMTVKSGASGAGGLAQRSEWEAPTQPGEFDFSIVTDDALRENLASLRTRLQPVFSTDFTRTAWTLMQAGSVVELALDRGKISVPTPGGDAAAISQPLCELELELVEGSSTDALFALAIELANDLHLHPEITSKAERGYALTDASLSTPVKAFASTVSRNMTPIDAFRSVALSCLTQLQRNEAGAILGGNPEYVHQARVAIRRLRSAFQLFSPVLGSSFVKTYAPRWGELARGLGSARDWDVFLSETLAPLEEAFPGDADLAVLRARGESSKAKAQASAGVTLKQEAYSRLLLAFTAALFRTESPTIEAKGKASKMALRKFASRRLQRRAEMIERLAVDHATMNAERRHDLRIAFKKLRYALEFFAPILPRKRLAVYQIAVGKIQDILGSLNDQVTASRLIKERHPKGERDLLTRGWIAGRTQLLIEALGSELREFVASDKPW